MTKRIAFAAIALAALLGVAAVAGRPDEVCSPETCRLIMMPDGAGKWMPR